MSSRVSIRERAVGKHLLVLAAYTLLSLLLTWPLAARLTTHVPGDGIDDPALVWNLWWIQERLVNQLSLDIFNVDWMFHPVRINLAFYTLTPLNGLLSIPLQSAFGLVVANNLLFLSTLVLGAYGTFLLTRSLLSRRRALLGTVQPASGQPVDRISLAGLFTTDDCIALVAGLTYGFASSKLFYASLGQFNIASSHWIPFFVFYVLRISVGRTPAVRNVGNGFRSAFMAGLFLVFQTWAELTYATFLVIFAVLTYAYTLVHLATARASVNGEEMASEGPPAETSSFRPFWIVTAQFAVVGLVFVIGLAPFLWAMAPDLLREGDFFTSGGGFSDVFSADLLGFLVPTRLHPWIGEMVAALPFPNDKGQQIYVGYAAMLFALLGVVGLVRSASRRLRSEGWFWLFTTVFFWWLTLGPTARWNGQSLGVPGPFVLVSGLPFFSGNRYPSRYSVMLMLCVAVLVAYGLAWLVDFAQRRRAFPQAISSHRLVVGLLAIFALTFTAEHLSTPLPLNDFRIPPIYSRLADLSEDAPAGTALLELPTGWRNGARVLGRSDVLIMMQQWYQSKHGQRRLGGNTSRNPAYKFQYFTDAPLIGDLIALMNADRDHIAQEVTRDWEAIVERNEAHAASVLGFLGVEYLVVHVDHSPEPLLQFVEEVLPVSIVDEWQGPDWQGRPSTIRLYEVESEEGEAKDIDLSDEMGRLYLAEGWSSLAQEGQPRYAVRPQAGLMIDLPTQGGDLSLQLFGPATAADLSVNGTFIETVQVEPGDWATFTLPSGVADQLVDRLAIRFHGAGISSTQIVNPASPGGWPIGNTGITLPVDAAIVVRSAGEEVGDFAHIYLNGDDVSQNERGYNLVAIDQKGLLLASDAFDTFASEEDSERMSEWIRQWPAGTIIAGSVRDEASMKLTDSAIAGLRQIGVSTDLRGQFRSSHAFVGVVGATVDELVDAALEERTLLCPSSVVLGSPVDAPIVYGGVSRVRLSDQRTD